MTGDKMFGWHHQFNGHEFEQALGDGEGQGAWCAVVFGVAKNLTRLSNRTATTYLEKTWRKILFRNFYLEKS